MKQRIKSYLKVFYLILICTLLPLYMKQGYYELGEAKGVMFMLISAAFVAVVVLLSLDKKCIAKLPKTEAAIVWLGFNFFFNVITLVFSVDAKVAFWGQEGWRCGFLTTVFMLLICFFYSKDIITNNYILAALLITPFLSFVLGIMNRFDIYPLEISGSNSSFIGTLGNINWFVGYISIFLPLGIALGFFQKWKTIGFYACNVYTFIGLVALFLIGSESGLLIIIGTYGVLLFLSLKERKKFRAFLVQLCILGIAMEIVSVLLFFFGGKYNYEENTLIIICTSHVGLIVAAIVLFTYRLSRLFEEISVPWVDIIYRRIMYVSLAILLLIIVAWAARGNIDGHFGNGRGIIWAISSDIFMDLTPLQKLFGIGHDCFYSYAYNNPLWAQSLLNVFDGNFLTNAHCEPLTMLIERGIVGVVCYYGMICMIISRLIRICDSTVDRKKEHTALVCVLPIVSYLFNSLVSFSTVTSTPYLFILLGISIGVSQIQESV